MAQQPLLDDDGSPLLDDNGNPLLDDTPDITPDTPAITPEPQPSGFSRVLSAMTTPLTDAPSRMARSFSNWITTPELDDAPLTARLKGFVGGAAEGVGDTLSSLTSPADLSAAVLTGGSSLAAKRGATTAARGLTQLARLASAPVAVSGASTMLNAEDLGDVGQGALELAGGVAGMTQRMPSPATKTPIVETPIVDTPITKDSSFFTKNRPSVPELSPTSSVPKTIYIRPSDTAVSSIKRAREMGYKTDGLDDKGRVKMVYTGKAQTIGTLETEIRNQRGGRSSTKQPKELSALEEAINLPRAIMASSDFSAPLRQGLPLIHKKAFWTSLDDMFKAWGSEDAYKAIQDDIKSRPLFKTRVGPDGKELPSFAEEAGLKISDLSDGREEALQSTWAEYLPGVRRSNRAYTAFLNKLRADTFENLVEGASIFGPPGTKANIPLAREIANFVNTASGRGSLGKLESSAKFLNASLFAPRLIASRIQILNPHYYWAANPIVRKEAMKSLLAVVGTGGALGQLAKMAGAEVHDNPTSADFGKIKIGDIRLDPFAGFQQYAVLASRLLKGEVESTTTGNTYKLGEKFGRPTRLDVLGRFIEGKANPVVSFATGLLRGKDFVGQPFDVPEELAARLLPIYIQDLKELLTENPKLVPFYHDEGAYQEFHPENIPYAIPPAFGMGMQSYGTMKQ